MRASLIVILAAATIAVAGCGSAGSRAASRPAPPGPITMSAFVGSHAVRVSPARFGAGPVLLTVANQSPHAAAVLLARAGSRRALARTAPIDPGGVTQVKVGFSPGRYTISAVAAGRRDDAQRARAVADVVQTVLRVGAQRTGGGDQVLAP